MPLGFDRELDLFNLNDTAEVFAYLYDRDDQLVDPSDILSVDFTIQRPDHTNVTVDGQVGDDGEGILRYDDTDVAGQYKVAARFTLVTGVKRSTRVDFEVIDPFNPPVASDEEVLAYYVWKKLEDCFDAADEGPYLRDVTRNVFNEKKMVNFLPEALWEVNERTPPTKLELGYFFHGPGDPTADLPLLAQAVFIKVLRHLIRSYIEQPDLTGAQALYENRRDYMQRWQAYYQIELEAFEKNLGYFKRRWLGLGSSKLLVDSKAGRLLPAPMRTRMTGRGYW